MRTFKAFWIFTPDLQKPCFVLPCIWEPINGCIPIPWCITYCRCTNCNCWIICCCWRLNCWREPEAFFLSEFWRICVCWMRFSWSCSCSCCIVCSICFLLSSANWWCWRTPSSCCATIWSNRSEITCCCCCCCCKSECCFIRFCSWVGLRTCWWRICCMWCKFGAGEGIIGGTVPWDWLYGGYSFPSLDSVWNNFDHKMSK